MNIKQKKVIFNGNINFHIDYIYVFINILFETKKFNKDIST